MAPLSSLTNVLDTSAASTLHPNGKTLPDISLGSVESSFRSEDEEARAQAQRDRLAGMRPTALSSNSSNSVTIATPSPPRLVSSALANLTAPRRSRVMRRASSEPDDDNTPAPDSDDGEDLLSMNMGSLRGSMAKPGGPSKRSGRHSVAAGEINTGATTLTLKEQEKLLDMTKKQNFSLQMENHFLKERLSNMAPEHMHAALAENAALKAQLTELARELKRHKKLVQEQHAAMQLQQGQGGRFSDDEVAKLKRELERKADTSQIQQDLQNQLEDAEASEAIYKTRSEALEDELENARASLDDQNEELERIRDQADRAQDELERLRAEMGGAEGGARLSQRLEELEQDNDSLLAEIEAHKKGIATRDLEREDLMREVERLKARLSEIEDSHEISKQAVGKARGAQADADELEETINLLRDKLAAAQIDLDNRDRDIEELNEEMDAKMREHEREIEQVESDWRDEVVDARGQVEELKDILSERDQELQDVRVALEEREDELHGAREQVAELQSMQQVTADRLEDTLRDIEQDNVEKDGDLVAANREIETLGQRVYDLEELVEDLRQKEQELSAELEAADQAFEDMRGSHGQLVDALKDKLANHKAEVVELREVYDQAREELDKHRREVDLLAQQNADHEARHRKDAEAHRRVIAEREQAHSRLQTELEAARDRVTTRDRDLDSVQSALRSLENERRMIGDEHTSDRFSLELEIDRLKRDLARCEDDLDAARDDLVRREEQSRQQEVELAEMLSKQQSLENTLSTERQNRLNMSEKLDQAQKIARRAERDADVLRERVDELEPLLTETQSDRLHLQKQSEQQHRERTELLLRVFKEVNGFLGAEDHTTPANFGVFRDTLVQRLRIMTKVRTDFEKRVKETEASVEQRMNALKRQLEQKWRALDTFEASVKKLEVTRMSWRSKYSVKDGELDGAKSRIAELQSQLSALKAGSSVDSSSQVRSLTERASAAEKRHTLAVNQLAAYEAKMAELQSRNGQAEHKWEARVKEYENRLRIASEKIKTEKQGGKERAAQLEAQVRDLEAQVDQAKRRNQRAEGVVARTAHLGQH